MSLPFQGRETIPLQDGELVFWPDFLPAAQAQGLFAELRQHTPWEQSEIRIAGRKIAIPRLNAWYGERGADYSYSGVALQTREFSAALASLKVAVEAAVGRPFNSALVNLYRHQRDSVDWHADDEPELGDNPPVASVSLGETRCFELRRKDDHRQRLKIALADGSLLLMRGRLQHYWQHRVAKEKSPCGERINITFRRVRLSRPTHSQARGSPVK